MAPIVDAIALRVAVRVRAYRYPQFLLFRDGVRILCSIDPKEPPMGAVQTRRQDSEASAPNDSASSTAHANGSHYEEIEFSAQMRMDKAIFRKYRFIFFGRRDNSYITFLSGRQGRLIYCVGWLCGDHRSTAAVDNRCAPNPRMLWQARIVLRLSLFGRPCCVS